MASAMMEGRRRTGISIGELAAMIGESRNVVSNVLNGRTKPDPELMAKVRKALNLPDSWPEIGSATTKPAESDEVRELPFDSLPKELQSLVRGDRVLLPLWRGVLGGDGECEFIEPDTVEWIEVPAFLAGRDYTSARVCKVAGMSMAPRIRQGDRVVVRLEPNPSPGMIVVAEKPEHGGRLIKVLREVKGGLELHSINEGNAPIVKLDGWSCIAVAIGIWTDREGGPNIEWNGGAPLRG